MNGPTSTTDKKGQQPSLSDLVDHLVQFDGPPEKFLLHLLAVQCHVASAESGTILRRDSKNAMQVLAVYPPVAKDQPSPVWLAQAVESAARVYQSGKSLVVPLHAAEDFYGQTATRHLAMLPIRGGQGTRGVACFVIKTADRNVVDYNMQRLELTIGLLSLYEMRLTLQRRGQDVQRMKQACEVLDKLNDLTRFKSAAMGFCNEVAARWKAQRVTVGLLDGRYIKAQASSHTEKFTRKMKLILDIEAAMEECYDQDVEVIVPAAADATYVCRATNDLSRLHGPNAICSVPLRRGGKAVGVLTVERTADNEFTNDEVEMLRLTADLVTSRFFELWESDKWFGARMVMQSRKAMAGILGPTYTWAKLLGIGLCALTAFLIFAHGMFRIDASFVIDATEKQIILAPFDGILESVGKDTQGRDIVPGSIVKANETILATFNVTERQLALQEALSKKAKLEAQAAVALRDGKLGEHRQALAEVQGVQAEIDTLRYYISRAEVKSQMTGIVTAGDRKREIGRQYTRQDALYEVAPIQNMRAELQVPEDGIAYIKVGKRGFLATASNPGTYIEFEVERINPVAEIVENHNVFKVRVKLLELEKSATAEKLPDGYHWLRPGMKGIAKIDIDEQAYLWIWTRDLVNWVRMKLWI